MKIQLLFFGPLKDVFGVSRSMKMPDHSAIQDVVAALLEESGKALPQRDALLYAVNQHFENEKKILRDEDELALMTPVSGG